MIVDTSIHTTMADTAPTTTSRSSGAVLAKPEILASIAAGYTRTHTRPPSTLSSMPNKLVFVRSEIAISPYDESAIGCASVDLTLSNEFRFFKPGHHVVDVTEDIDFKDITEHVVLPEGESWLLLPGTACLGITQERVTLSSNLCGLLGTSRYLSRLDSWFADMSMALSLLLL